jgi:hypothetical protein
MEARPQREDLQVSAWCHIRRLAVERIVGVDQIWAHVEHADGTRAAYVSALEGPAGQAWIGLLRDAFDRHHEVFFHYQDEGRVRRFYAVTLVWGG